jgi:hypothetical protein
VINLKTGALSRGWFVLACVLIVFELIFLYEAMQADLAGYQKIFGVFVGLAILCFAALAYSFKVVFYD